MAANTATAAATSTVNPIAAAATSAGGSLLGTIASGIFNTYQAKKQQEWNEKMQDKQNAWSLDMWNKTNEYNSPKEQIKRLQDAGLNPLYYGLDGSSANGLESAQALGYDRADMKNIENPLGVGVQTMMQAKSLDKEMELKNAQIDKLKEEASGVKLDNEWKDRTMDARVQSEQLANNLTKKQIDQVESQIKINEQEVKKKMQETDNLVEQKALIIAEKALKDAEAKQIVELMPYQKNLLEAQTLAQKAAASASYMNAMYQKGLIDSGYIDKLVEAQEAAIKRDNNAADAQEAIKSLNAWKLSVRNGNLFDLSDANLAERILGNIFNGFFGDIAAISEAVGGGLSGFLK